MIYDRIWDTLDNVANSKPLWVGLKLNKQDFYRLERCGDLMVSDKGTFSFYRRKVQILDTDVRSRLVFMDESEVEIK